jgi:hypothetical protein
MNMYVKNFDPQINGDWQSSCGNQVSQFADLIAIKLRNTSTLSDKDEKALLSDAVLKMGIPLRVARQILSDQIGNSKVVMQSESESALESLVKAMVDRKNKISRKNFNLAVSFGIDRLRISKKNIEQKIKKYMVDNSIKPSGDGLFRSTRWFRAIEDI